jgi:phosphoribosylanthranilate isomerase
VNTKVKICGVRRLDDALLAAELGASAIGFIFWPGSPRFIDPFRARPIAAALPPLVAAVGVFVDQPADYIAGVAGLVKLAAVQLHGQETPASYERLHYRVIKSVAVDEGFDPACVNAVPTRATVLLDAHDPVRRGGTGRPVDWARAADAAKRRAVILSGGLTPDNVASAVATVHPYAIDVSSGVETSAGVKDHDKLRALFMALDPERTRL